MTTIKDFIEPHTRGGIGITTLMGSQKSSQYIEETLKKRGVKASSRVIGEALKSEGFCLQANKKRDEGVSHPDRDTQFNYINNRIKEYHSDNQLVIFVDAKMRELVRNFQNAGREWQKNIHRKKSPHTIL